MNLLLDKISTVTVSLTTCYWMSGKLMNFFMSLRCNKELKPPMKAPSS